MTDLEKHHNGNALQRKQYFVLNVRLGFIVSSNWFGLVWFGLVMRRFKPKPNQANGPKFVAGFFKSTGVL